MAPYPSPATGSAAHPPWKTWAEIAIEHGRVRRDRQRLQVWVNTRLGESWEDQAGDTVPADPLMARREDWGEDLPTGVDVQGDRIEVQILGWGRDEEAWVIDYRVLWGDPSGPRLWSDLDMALQATLPHPAGIDLPVRAATIDAGGHHTKMAYEFCRTRLARRIWAIKGRGGPGILVWRANSKAKVQELLTTDKRGLIISMIHKFEGIDKDANTRENIYVFIDEAHRSVAKDLGTYMMAAVPNATIIGFTGTPIAKTAQGEGTFKIFGTEDEQGYLDKYSIRESIEDETTLLIRHTMAPSEMTVPAERLDKEFFERAAAEGVTDIDELNKVLDRAVGLRTFLTADDRIEKVAAFVAEHFKEKVLPLGYKAFLVGVNREACAKYKRALDKLLPPEWSEAVYTESAADVVDRPLVAELQLSPEREADVRLLFKKPNEDPKILIVTDKLLTGYDAPLLYCMYLDKPMRDHVLLQAIARVNRPYVDANGVQKRVGLVVDFVGVLRELKKALQFDSSEVSGVIEDLDLLLKDFVGRIEKAKVDYLDAGDESSADEKLEKLVYGRFLDPEPRKAFFEAYKEIEALWEILSPSPELRDHITTFKRLAQLYAAVRNAYADRVGYVADLGYKTRRLVEESATQEGLGKLTKTVTFDVETLEGLRGEPGSDERKVFNLVRGLQKEIEDEADTAPVLQSLKDRAERILKDLENRNTTGLAAMDMLAALAKEKEEAIKAAKDSGLSTRAFGVCWNLKDDEALRNAGISAMELARDAETEMHRFLNARVNDDERRKLRATLYRPLLGLGKEDRGRVVDLVLAILLDGDHDAAA